MKDSDVLEKVVTLQNGLFAFSAGGDFGGANYGELRQLVTTHPRLKKLTPDFLKTNRTLEQFWAYIKTKFAHWAERRKYLWEEFAPLIEELEGKTNTPADDGVSEILIKFDPEMVHAVWEKALVRRREDPEAALTSARTLLETVCKHILDQEIVEYPDDADLPKLFKTVATELNLAPSQHSELVFKQILGGCTAVVEGLGSLRNRLSDAHGKGVRSVKPDSRHAELAVNLAGSMATFLIETWEHRKK